jgi:ribosomal protein S21
MRVAVQHNDVQEAMRILRKKLRIENEDHHTRLRAIPKPSERKKAKARTADARRRNQIKRQGEKANGY